MAIFGFGKKSDKARLRKIDDVQAPNAAPYDDLQDIAGTKSPALGGAVVGGEGAELTPAACKTETPRALMHKKPGH